MDSHANVRARTYPGCEVTKIWSRVSIQTRATLIPLKFRRGCRGLGRHFDTDRLDVFTESPTRSRAFLGMSTTTRHPNVMCDPGSSVWHIEPSVMTRTISKLDEQRFAPVLFFRGTSKGIGMTAKMFRTSPGRGSRRAWLPTKLLAVARVAGPHGSAWRGLQN